MASDQQPGVLVLRHEFQQRRLTTNACSNCPGEAFVLQRNLLGLLVGSRILHEEIRFFPQSVPGIGASLFHFYYSQLVARHLVGDVRKCMQYL